MTETTEDTHRLTYAIPWYNLWDKVASERRVNALSDELFSIWRVLKFDCSKPSLALYVCKAQYGDDPRVCVDESISVLRCSQKTLDTIRGSCGLQFQKHANCLDKNNLRMFQCRDEEQELMTCASLTQGIPLSSYYPETKNT